MSWLSGLSATARPCFDEFKITTGCLGVDFIFRIKKAAQAVDQAFDGFDIQLLAASKGVNDLRLGKPFIFVPDVVRQLDIFHAGAVFVFTLNSSDIHAYL